MANLDQFTRAYLAAAFWSSTENPFGGCPQCKQERVLCRLNEAGTLVCSECGKRETNSEPPMDENYSIEDLAPETLTKMIEDCTKFQADHGEIINEETCLNYGSDGDGPDGYAGHDFWLTRNGHGAGFWDGDWAEPAATRLTGAAKAFGEFNLYVGDDGKIYHTS